MRQKPSSCEGCACYSHGNDFSAIEGTGSSGVMLVGEASGEHEQRDQLPFRPFAPAGGVLERVLRRMSLDRQQLSVTNVVRCRPRNNWLEGAPWEFGAINHCRANLDAAIAERRPRCIVALGGVATRALTGLAGTALGVNHLAGYVLPLRDALHWKDGRKLSSRHRQLPPGLSPPRQGLASGRLRPHPPARGEHRRGARPRLAVERQPGRQVDVAGHRTDKYVSHPTVGDAAEFYFHLRDNANVAFSYDIETAESASIDEDAREGFADTQIQLVQFSAGAGTAIAMPWQGDFKRIVQSILHLPNVKMGHNVWLFDNKVLAACGDREGLDLRPRGVVHDTLCMFHHWQPDLPAHLQFAASFVQFPFPWKHLAATDIEFYGCCDVDATLRLYGMLEATLRRDGLWDDGVAA